MQNIPLLKLDSFEKYYMEPTGRIPEKHRALVRQSPDAYFSIFERTEHPCKTEIDIHRSDFYKILLITKGSGTLFYGTEQYDVQPDCILFLKPIEVRGWQAATSEQEGYYCMFNEQFFVFTTRHLQELRSNPLFQPGKTPILPLDACSIGVLRPIFEKLFKEYGEMDQYNPEIIRMYLHILLMESARFTAGPLSAASDLPAASLLSEKFFQLLEAAFLACTDGENLRLKFPSDFASKLCVHTNHLNALVKKATGKTVSTHIQDRLLAEARLYLTHTNLNVTEIAYRLGFKENSHFGTFFKKYAKVSPLEYKKAFAAVQE